MPRWTQIGDQRICVNLCLEICSEYPLVGSARRSYGSSQIFTDADGLKSVFNQWKLGEKLAVRFDLD